MAEAATITTAQESAICIDDATWGAALMRYRMADIRAKREWDAFVAYPDDGPDVRLLGDLTTESQDAADVAEDALMAMPAPHLAALRWKLDKIITFDGDDPDFMQPYAAKYVAQTIADYKRLLPEAL